ncbi:glycosyltransferase family 2 protein [Actinomycetaceae bacterium L2_0104]
MGSLLIIIPAWNEEEALPQVLAEIKATAGLDADIIVVDDGSNDSTSAVARACGVEVLTLPLNLGVGGAMRAGYLYAKRNGYEAAVQVDADGQHRPSDIAKLVQCMEETGSDIVIGARFAGVGEYKVRGPRAWAMRVLSRRLSRQCRASLTDTTSGFKLTNRRAIDLFAADLPAEYLGDTIEALVIAAKEGLRINQVGVQMRERQGGSPSHSPLQAAMFLGRALFAIIMAGTRRSAVRGSDV